MNEKLKNQALELYESFNLDENKEKIQEILISKESVFAKDKKVLYLLSKLNSLELKKYESIIKFINNEEQVLFNSKTLKDGEMYLYMNGSGYSYDKYEEAFSRMMHDDAENSELVIMKPKDPNYVWNRKEVSHSLAINENHDFIYIDGFKHLNLKKEFGFFKPFLFKKNTFLIINYPFSYFHQNEDGVGVFVTKETLVKLIDKDLIKKIEYTEFGDTPVIVKKRHTNYFSLLVINHNFLKEIKVKDIKSRGVFDKFKELSALLDKINRLSDTDVTKFIYDFTYAKYLQKIHHDFNDYEKLMIIYSSIKPYYLKKETLKCLIKNSKDASFIKQAELYLEVMDEYLRDFNNNDKPALYTVLIDAQRKYIFDNFEEAYEIATNYEFDNHDYSSQYTFSIIKNYKDQPQETQCVYYNCDGDVVTIKSLNELLQKRFEEEQIVNPFYERFINWPNYYQAFDVIDLIDIYHNERKYLNFIISPNQDSSYQEHYDYPLSGPTCISLITKDNKFALYEDHMLNNLTNAVKKYDYSYEISPVINKEIDIIKMLLEEEQHE